MSSSQVQKHYAKFVTGGGEGPHVLQERGQALGYSDDLVPSSLRTATVFQASCGSGCPLGDATINQGETVCDLGCGAGHDVLLASHMVGPNGKVIGVDLTPEMIAAARDNAKQYPHLAPSIELLQASLEDRDSGFVNQYRGKIDVVISNGVFNLCHNKLHAFQTVLELLKPGGRFWFSDVCKLEQANPDASLVKSIGDVFSS